MYDERSFITPRWFEKVESVNALTKKKEYSYKPKGNAYWEAREKGDWCDVP